MLTTSPPGALLGVQQPRVSSVPESISTDGQEAVELAASAGLFLDPWQRTVLDLSLGYRPDGRWSAFEVGLLVPRQNGKGSILEARELAGLFLFGESLILHSAHEFKTAAEAFRRLLTLVEGSDDLRRKVKRVRSSHGEEGIELLTGQRIRFVARTTGSGRGFTGDCVILDEAYALTDTMIAALLPTLSARRNPQVWYTSSAGMVTSTVLANVRKRGLEGSDPRLCYLEWSADPDADLDSPEALAQANPGLGIRLSEEFSLVERGSMSPEGYARERLGLFSDSVERVIPLGVWRGICGDVAPSPKVFAVDINPERSWASIAAADDKSVELVDHRSGTGWLHDRIVELSKKYQAPFAIDVAGPAGTFIEALEKAGVAVRKFEARQYVYACQSFYDRCMQGTVRVRSNTDLDEACAGATQRTAGDGWAWARRNDQTVISPLVAVTLAAAAPVGVNVSVMFV